MESRRLATDWDRLGQTVFIEVLKDVVARRTLNRAVSSYTAYDWPCRGDSRTFDPAQAARNLGYFFEVKEERLAHVSALLAQFDLDASSAFDGRWEEFLRQLNMWASKTWGGIYSRRHSDTEYWYRHSLNDIPVYAFLMDIALIIGDLAISQSEGKYHWDVDTALSNRDMGTWGRVCVLHAPVGVNSKYVFDAEGGVFLCYQDSKNAHTYRGRQLGRGMEYIIVS